MLDSVLGVAALGIVVLCTSLFYRLRRERETVASLQTTAADLGGRVRFLADRTQQPIVMFDARGLIRHVNPAAEKMCGYRAQELLGQSFLRLVPASPSGRGEAEVRCKDGSRVRRRFSSARTGNPDAPDVYLFFDLFEPEVEIDPVPEPVPPDPVPEMPAQATIEDVVNRIVRQFEDLLTTISGYTELALHATPLTSPIRKDLEEVATASDTASNLARNLLAYSGRQTIPVESIDLNALVGGLEAGLRTAVKGSFHVALAAERPTVVGNGECLGQILMILCTSAHHRVNGDGRIEIRTEKRRLAEPLSVYTGKVPEGIYSVLTVSDSGRPIESKTLAHMFEPLFLDREAVGIELAPVHGIVRNLGGWINVISREKAGTTFEVLFPYAGDFEVGKARTAGSLVG